MRFSHVFSGLLAFSLGTSAAPSRPQKPSHSLLQWTPPPAVPELVPAFQAKIDWDLDNGRQFGVILRANDDGIVTPGTTPGTEFLELLINYVVKLDDGYWAYVTHRGGAIVRQYQNGVVRVETDSPKYDWLNRIDFTAPGTFNKTEVMTVNHYFPNRNNLPNGLPDTIRH
ncbi:hypothetical protein ACO1O0_004837 [Amphichorda felina]